MSKSKKEEDNKKYRERKRDEVDYIEKVSFKNTHPKKQIDSKSKVDQERTNKLLSRGIPSHFYKNLNKSQN